GPARRGLEARRTRIALRPRCRAPPPRRPDRVHRRVGGAPGGRAPRSPTAERISHLGHDLDERRKPRSLRLGRAAISRLPRSGFAPRAAARPTDGDSTRADRGAPAGAARAGLWPVDRGGHSPPLHAAPHLRSLARRLWLRIPARA